jgi:hypothetical protein
MGGNSKKRSEACAVCGGWCRAIVSFALGLEDLAGAEHGPSRTLRSYPKLSSASIFFLQSGQMPWVNLASVRSLR